MADLDRPADGSDPFGHDLTTYNEWFRFSNQLRTTTLYEVKSNIIRDTILPSLIEQTPQNIKAYLIQQFNTLNIIVKAHNRMVESFNNLVDEDGKIFRSLSRQAKTSKQMSELIAWGKASRDRQERFAQNIKSIQISIGRISTAATDVAATYM